MFIIDFFHKICRGYTDKEMRDVQNQLDILRQTARIFDVPYYSRNLIDSDDLFDFSYGELCDERDILVAKIVTTNYFKFYIYLLKNFGGEFCADAIPGVEQALSSNSVINEYASLLIDIYRDRTTTSEAFMRCLEIMQDHISSRCCMYNDIIPEFEPEKDDEVNDEKSSTESQPFPNPKSRGEVKTENNRKKRRRKVKTR
jgi:hypothetical protein